MNVRAAAAFFVALALATDFACAAPAAYREAIYAIWLNGDPVAENAIVLEASGGRFAFAASDLQAWGVVLPKAVPIIVDGKPFYPITDFPGAKVQVDSATERLDVTIPADLFTTIELKARDVAGGAVSSTVPGYYVNYDVHAEAGSGSTSNLLIDAGTQLGGGVVDTSVITGQLGGYGNATGVVPIGSPTTQSFAVQRLNTQWRADDINNHTTLTIGDAVTGPSAFADQVYFAGIGYGRNFSTEPWLSPQPLPSISGTANVPSLLDVYVNNVLAYSEQVDIGPFRVTNLPNVNGLGQVQMVLRNAQGGQQIVTGSYYTSNNLLAKGLSDFSYDAGFVNYNYGQLGSYYGEFVARASQRYGFTDTLTGALFAEYAAHDAVFGIAANSVIGKMGTLGLGVAAGTSRQGGGAETIVNYDFLSPRFGIGFQGKISSSNFLLAGGLSNGFQRELLGHANVQLGRRTSMSASYGEGYFYGNYVSAPSVLQGRVAPTYQRVSTVTIRESLGLRSYVQLFGSRTGGSSNQNTVNAEMIWLLGPTSQASSFVQSVNGATGPGLSFSHSTGTLGAISYNAEIATGPGGYAVAQAQQYGAHGIVAAGFSTGSGGSAVAADVSGALIDVKGHTFLTQPVQEAYGAAIVAGYPNVPVFAVNQPIGATNKNGYAPLPLLVPYSDNPVSIDPQALPFAANVEQTTVMTRPRYRLPVLVRFGAENAGGFIVHLIAGDGKPLAAGSIVRDPTGHEWPVGDGGLLYVGGLPGGTTVLTATVGVSTCRLSLTVPANTSSVPDLGAAICK